MKSKLSILTLVGLAACSLASFAQENPPPAEQPPATSTAMTTNDAAPAAPAAKDPAASDASAPNAAAAPAAASPVALTNAGTVIPLIVMDDVPLTDAIKNLARQAGLNYMLDPKVAFGQVGPDGRPVPQPMVSVRWENVTAEQALTALLGNYNLQLTEDPRSKIARVTVRDPAAPDPLVTKVIQLKYASPTNIMMAIQNTFVDPKRSKVVPDVRTSQLVVVATEKEIAEVDQLVEKLDTPTKQVLIEARLLETSMNPSTTKGVDWSGTLAAQHVRFGNGVPFAIPPTAPTPPTAANPAGDPGFAGLLSRVLDPAMPMIQANTANGFNPSTFFLNADGVTAVLSFLNKYAEAKVLSTPRTVTLDNETARLEVVRATPIINVTPGTVQVSGGSQITYTNLGIILNVTPRISANDQVNLKVVPEVSRVFDTVSKVINGNTFQVDEYDIRKVETRVMVPSGNTLVLGGLVQDDIRNSNIKVPVLGDIPGLGLLFRNDTKSRQKSNLLVFITPTIVQDGDFQPTPSDYLKTPVPTTDYLEPEWSAWNSGKPRDWSNPEPRDSGKFSDLSSKKKTQ